MKRAGFREASARPGRASGTAWNCRRHDPGPEVGARGGGHPARESARIWPRKRRRSVRDRETGSTSFDEAGSRADAGALGSSLLLQERESATADLSVSARANGHRRSRSRRTRTTTRPTPSSPAGASPAASASSTTSTTGRTSASRSSRMPSTTAASGPNSSTRSAPRKSGSPRKAPATSSRSPTSSRKCSTAGCRRVSQEELRGTQRAGKLPLRAALCASIAVVAKRRPTIDLQRERRNGRGRMLMKSSKVPSSSWSAW